MKRNLLSCAAAAAIACLAVGAQAEVPTFYFPHANKVVPGDKLASYGKNLPVSKTLKAPGGITWNITYVDGAGVGFNDATFGAARKATLDAVLVYIDSVLGETGTCDIEVDASEFGGDGFLAAAGTSFFGSPTYQGGTALTHITTGTDPNPGGPEISMVVDFGYPWHLGTGPIPGSPTQFDLFSVLLHEITHGLGILSLTNDGTGASQIPGVYTKWDELLYQTSNNTRVWNAGGTYQASSLTGGNNTIDFRGAAAAAIFGTSPYAPIYTPGPFEGGSSVSHWQLVAPISSDAVMRPAITNNVENRTYEPFEIGALQDLGYDLEASSLPAWMQY